MYKSVNFFGSPSSVVEYLFIRSLSRSHFDSRVRRPRIKAIKQRLDQNLICTVQSHFRACYTQFQRKKITWLKNTGSNLLDTIFELSK